MSFHDPLFKGYMADTEDHVNLPLRDDAAAYEDENRIEMPGDFIEKLSKGTATARREDDLDEPQPANLTEMLRSRELQAALRSPETRDRIAAALLATKKRARELEGAFGLSHADAIRKARCQLGFEKSLAGGAKR
jgi:hypothetical protein